MQAVANPGSGNDIISGISEEELLNSKTLLQLVLVGTDEGIWGWDTQTGLITLSRNWLHVFTHEPETQTVDFEWWQQLVHPDSFPEFERAFQDYREGKTKYYELEYQVKDKNGEWIWLWEKGLISEYDGAGNPLKMIGTHRDITKQKKAEKKRNELIEELQKALGEIKTLRGILPLCSFCKKIRDDKGYWEQVDVYIHKYSGADISHSICPECLKKNYPKEHASIYDGKNKDS